MDELELVLVQSTRAHARVKSVDYSAALAVEGVEGVVTHEDLPEGRKLWGLIVKDEPLFVVDEVTQYGQVRENNAFLQLFLLLGDGLKYFFLLLAVPAVVAAFLLLQFYYCCGLWGDSDFYYHQSF